MRTKAPTPLTLKHLYARSGNCCAYPKCLKEFSITDNSVLNNLSEVCHIEASSQGGERWNEDMTEKERHGFNNLIILCFDHHKLIDNPENSGLYTVAILKEWKKQHERDIKDKIHKNLPL